MKQQVEQNEALRLKKFAERLWFKYSYQYVDSVIAFVKEHHRELYTDALEAAKSETVSEAIIENILRVAKDECWDDLEELIRDHLSEYLEDGREYSKEELFSVLDENCYEVEDEIRELASEVDLFDNEISGYIAVNPNLKQWLQEQGEIVLSILDLDVWCRSMSGQAEWADDCFQAIAKDKGDAWDWEI